MKDTLKLRFSPFNDVRVVGDPGELLQQPYLTTQREKGQTQKT